MAQTQGLLSIEGNGLCCSFKCTKGRTICVSGHSKKSTFLQADGIIVAKMAAGHADTIAMCLQTPLPQHH